MIILPKSPGGIGIARDGILKIDGVVSEISNSANLYLQSERIYRANAFDMSDKGYVPELLANLFLKKRSERPTVRVVFPPPGPVEAEMQRQLSKRLSAIRVHNACFGFVKGRSCYKAAMSHAAYWGFPGQGDVSYLKADMRNFFHSVDGSMISKTLEAHRIDWVTVDSLRECGGLLDLYEGSSGSSRRNSIVDSTVRRVFSIPHGYPNVHYLSELMVFSTALEEVLTTVSDHAWERLDDIVRDAVGLGQLQIDISEEDAKILCLLRAIAAPKHLGGSSLGPLGSMFPLTYLLCAPPSYCGLVSERYWDDLFAGRLTAQVGHHPTADLLREGGQQSVGLFASARSHFGANNAHLFMPRCKDQVALLAQLIRFLADSICDILSLPRASKSSLFTPQGASTSPALSNLAAKPLDYRMAKMAEDETLCYTRYADDTTFSWSGRRTMKEINLLKWKISKNMTSCGFVPNLRKFVIMGPGMRQKVLGYAMNSGRPTIPGPRRKEILERSARLVAKESTQGTRGNDLQELKSAAGMISWCREAHRDDARIEAARVAVDRRMRELLGGGVSSCESFEIFAEHHAGSGNVFQTEPDEIDLCI